MPKEKIKLATIPLPLELHFKLDEEAMRQTRTAGEGKHVSKQELVSDAVNRYKSDQELQGKIEKLLLKTEERGTEKDTLIIKTRPVTVSLDDNYTIKESALKLERILQRHVTKQELLSSILEQHFSLTNS